MATNPKFRIELPHLSGVADYQVEQAILLLRHGIEGAVNSIHERIDQLPAPPTLPEIQQALSPTGAYPLPTASLLNTVPPPSNPIPPPPQPVQDGIPNHLDIVTAVFDANPLTPTSTPEEEFRFTQRVVQAILAAATDPPGLLCGLFLKPTGDNIFTCNGETYSISRCCYNNGHLFKVIRGASPGGNRQPGWDDESPPLVPDRYHVATDPDAPC